MKGGRRTANGERRTANRSSFIRHPSSLKPRLEAAGPAGRRPSLRSPLSPRDHDLLQRGAVLLGGQADGGAGGAAADAGGAAAALPAKGAPHGHGLFDVRLLLLGA